MGQIVKGNYYGSVTVGERGQIVLPAEVRKEFGIQQGDKILVYGRMDHGRIELFTADLVTKLMNQTMDEIGDLGKMIQEIKQKKETTDSHR
jgi:AbrB family looped-hinge helix DNA binding protein